MELGLSLGDSSIPPGLLMRDQQSNMASTAGNREMGLCMSLGISSEKEKSGFVAGKFSGDGADRRLLSLQLNLLPNSPVPVQSDYYGSSDGGSSTPVDLNVNRKPPQQAALEEEEEIEDGFAGVSSPNSAASSLGMDFGIYNGGYNKRVIPEASAANDGARAASSNEDDNDNNLSRKKLRLSKEQSAFLEESFKEHNTLNPKQKLALAKELNLRPRQVEVWFQNRRARTKLKQTEVDCEYLKRCCETLTEENRRLHKELQELRALKNTNSNPFLVNLPATTLTMCPSCERIVGTGGSGPSSGNNKPTSKPMYFPFNSLTVKSSTPS